MGGYLSGYGTVSGAVSGGVFITADGGALKVQGSLAGDKGNFTIDGGATLELSNGTAAPVIFDGNSATLKLDAPAAFTGVDRRYRRWRRDRSCRDYGEFRDLQRHDADDQRDQRSAAHLQQRQRQRNGRYRHRRQRQQWRDARLLVRRAHDRDHDADCGRQCGQQGRGGGWICHQRQRDRR